MGILGLSKLIADIAPMSVKESEIKHYFGMYNTIALFDFTQRYVLYLDNYFSLHRSKNSN